MRQIGPASRYVPTPLAAAAEIIQSGATAECRYRRRRFGLTEHRLRPASTLRLGFSMSDDHT